MAASIYKGTSVRRHRRTDAGHKARHSKGFLASFLASFRKPTEGYGGRHRNDRQSNHLRGSSGF
jgi:hypothetical protein